jgi:hypothetical protein
MDDMILEVRTFSKNLPIPNMDRRYKPKIQGDDREKIGQRVAEIYGIEKK